MSLSKELELSPRGRRKSGTILIVVLWILVILTALAMTLGRGTHVDLAMTKFAVAKLQSRYLGWAGLMYGLERIRRDSPRSQEDTLSSCAIVLGEGEDLEKVFKEKLLGEGYFSIGDVRKDSDSEGAKEITYGFQDEERKININALGPQNAGILESLISSLGFDASTAETVAMSVVDWQDRDNTESKEGVGAEDAYYMGLPKSYHCKNRPFDSKEELLLVRGMTPEVLAAIRDYVTVFPKEGILKINFNTAPRKVLEAVAVSFSGALTNTDEGDAQSLVQKMIDYRRGEDQMEGTSDDRPIDFNALGTNAKEKALFLTMTQVQTKKSNYVNIHVRGVVPARDVQTDIEAVIARGDLSVQSWRRN